LIEIFSEADGSEYTDPYYILGQRGKQVSYAAVSLKMRSRMREIKGVNIGGFITMIDWLNEIRNLIINDDEFI
jgi:hypothetical protein